MVWSLELGGTDGSNSILVEIVWDVPSRGSAELEMEAAGLGLRDGVLVMWFCDSEDKEGVGVGSAIGDGVVVGTSIVVGGARVVVGGASDVVGSSDTTVVVAAIALDDTSIKKKSLVYLPWLGPNINRYIIIGLNRSLAHYPISWQSSVTLFKYSMQS